MRLFFLVSLGITVVGLADLAYWLVADRENVSLLVLSAFFLLYGILTMNIINYQYRRRNRLMETRAGSFDMLDFPDMTGMAPAEKLRVLEERYRDGRMDHAIYDAIKRQIEMELASGDGDLGSDE